VQDYRYTICIAHGNIPDTTAMRVRFRLSRKRKGGDYKVNNTKLLSQAAELPSLSGRRQASTMVEKETV
jgi:hypothetical protein